MKKSYNGLREQYMTILKPAIAETEERKSKFIAHVKPIETEDEALEFISELKTKYWNASHNVYAYYIGGEVTVQRFSDDGEPSGTAGLPVLEVIKRMGLEDLVIVVTRYFGGTLLGAGGLVRAYGKSASSGIEASGVITKKLCEQINITIEYPLLGKVQNYTQESGYKTMNIEYTENVEMDIYVPVAEIETFFKAINDVTNGSIVMSEGIKKYSYAGKLKK